MKTTTYELNPEHPINRFLLELKNRCRLTRSAGTLLALLLVSGGHVGYGMAHKLAPWMPAQRFESGLVELEQWGIIKRGARGFKLNIAKRNGEAYLLVNKERQR